MLSLKVYKALLIKEMTHHKDRRDKHRNHRCPRRSSDTPAKDADKDIVKNSIEYSPYEHGVHGFAWIARGAYDRVVSHRKGSEDISRYDDLQILFGKRNTAFTTAKEPE